VTPDSLNFGMDAVPTGITDPGYSAARDRSSLQQTRVTAAAAEWHAAWALAEISGSASVSALKWQ